VEMNIEIECSQISGSASPRPSHRPRASVAPA
jgi:hypothetical protein